jgi:copper chaperone NosL
MHFRTRLLIVALWGGIGVLSLQTDLVYGQAEEVKPEDRCAVCGMFVAKYPNWLSRIQHADGTILWFDGAKDMLAYYFNPGQFGPHSSESILDIRVKDYYSLAWTPARQAFFVTGSDVSGPMGHEFIPFSSREAAASFLKDHRGKKVWTFGEITATDVEALRSGHMMKNKKHGGHQPGGDEHGRGRQMTHDH